jgi:hypothetical protein
MFPPSLDIGSTGSAPGIEDIPVLLVAAIVADRPVSRQTIGSTGVRWRATRRYARSADAAAARHAADGAPRSLSRRAAVAARAVGKWAYDSAGMRRPFARNEIMW